MRQMMTMVLLAISMVGSMAQTTNVRQGNVIYAFEANENEMTYNTSEQTLTIDDKTFKISNITEIVIDETTVEANTVSVSYDGAQASVVIAGNLAAYVTATVSGGHVSISQTNSGAVDGDEITYVLSGESSDGSFNLDGQYKCTIQLAGVTLTNPNGAAITINNKKRIQISVKKDTENSLTDCTGGSQKGCLYSKGQLQLQGKGALTVTGNTAHAIKCGDYVAVKNLTLTVKKAVKDGISCNKYFVMESGSVSISGVGDDGIQTEFEEDDAITGVTSKHEDENSGNVYIEDGNLEIATTANGAKCVKADSTIYINGGTLTLTASGGVDQSDSSDPSYVAAFGCGKFVQNGGTITITVKGTAGRGVKAYDIETNGGEMTITNSAAPTTIASDVKSAKGLKGLNIALNAGTISITMSGNASKAIRCGEGTKTSGGGGGGWRAPGGGGWPGGGGGGMGGGSTWTNISGSYQQGLTNGTGPKVTISQTGGTSSSSSAKAIKAICAATIYGGETEITTTKSGAEGLESKTSIDVQGGKHYLKCYDDCMNSAGKISFNGGITVCYSTGNDAIDSNAGTNGAITIGNGTVLAYMTKGDPDEAFDCDNNNYIQITGTGIAVGAGGKQSSATGTLSGAKQGYSFPGTVSFKANVYNTLADASGQNLVTFQLPVAINSTCTFFTATGMGSGSKYTVKSSSTAPTDAATVWHGLYLGSSATGTTSVASFTAK